MKADAMSMYDPEPTREAWHLLRKMSLLVLVVIATAFGLVLLSRQKSNVPLFLFNVLADASLGLLAGLATRFILKGRHGLIQALASTAISFVGLGVLGYFTNWKSGIGPFQAGWIPVHWLDAAHISLFLPLEFTRGAMDQMDLLHAVVAIEVSWMALRVWRGGPRVTGQPSMPSARARRVIQPAALPADPVEPVVVTPAVVPMPVPAPKRPATSGSRSSRSRSSSSRSSSSGLSSSSSGSRSRIRRRNTERAVIARPTSAVRPVRSRSRHNGTRHSHVAVHLAVHEEHKCPYCFQPVSRNDPRGVVECQICHTLHHKDCWDITGNCQVPHLTTL